MPRAARVMVPGWPFHNTHRANERKPVFTNDELHITYMRLLHRYARQFDMAVWAYCLMDNHVHLITVGETSISIPRAIGNTHRHFSRLHNKERGVTGHLWANRFFSTALDQTHLWAAVRYVELNPVRSGLVRHATDYEWSSARAHAGLTTDRLLASDSPFPGPIGDWAAWLDLGLETGVADEIRKNTYSGRPTGTDEFVAEAERMMGRPLRSTRSGSNAGTFPKP